MYICEHEGDKDQVPMSNADNSSVNNENVNISAESQKGVKAIDFVQQIAPFWFSTKHRILKSHGRDVRLWSK